MSEKTVETSQEIENKAPETVEKTQFDKLLERFNSTDKELKTLRDQQKNSQTQQLKEKEQYKELWEKEQTEKQSALDRANKLQESYLSDKKYSAFSDAARKLGIKPEAISDLEMVDLTDVQIETTSTGKINVLGADKFAERLKSLKPHWFQANPPTVNTNGVRTLESTGTVSVGDVMDAEKEGRKSGDMTKYKGLVLKFNQQRSSGSK